MSKREVFGLLKLGIPIAIGLLASMLMQIIDTMFIGRVSTVALGGAALGNAIYSVVMVLGVGISSSLDFLIAKDVGSKKWRGCQNWFLHGLIVAIAYSIPSIFIMRFSVNALHLFGIAPDIIVEAKKYLNVLSLSFPAFMMFLIAQKYLQAFHRVRSAMVALLLANIVNAIANYIFVFGKFGAPALGVVGSALSTNFARIFMVVILYYDLFKFDFKAGRNWNGFKIESKYFKTIFKIGLPAGLQVLLEVSAFAMSTFLAGKLGAESLSAHQIVLYIASFTFMIPLGLSIAASVKVGNAVGELNMPLAILSGYSAIYLGISIMFVIGISMIAFKNPLLHLFTNIDEVITSGAGLILIAACFQVFDSTQVVGTGVLRGVGNTRASLFANLIGHWVIGLPLGILLCFHFHLGIQGIWLGLTSGLVFVSVTLYFVWKKYALDSISKV